MKFHSKCHGEDIALSKGATVATRTGMVCNGIVFGNRPVAPGEKIIVEIRSTISEVRGAFCFGFSNHNPDRIDPKSLPVAAIPDLTDKPGYWAQNVDNEEDVSEGTRFSYWCTGNTVECTINGKPWVPRLEPSDRNYNDLAKFVDVQKPMWPLFNVYGQTESVKISVEHVEVQGMVLYEKLYSYYFKHTSL